VFAQVQFSDGSDGGASENSDGGANRKNFGLRKCSLVMGVMGVRMKKTLVCASAV